MKIYLSLDNAGYPFILVMLMNSYTAFSSRSKVIVFADDVRIQYIPFPESDHSQLDQDHHSTNCFKMRKCRIWWVSIDYDFVINQSKYQLPLSCSVKQTASIWSLWHQFMASILGAFVLANFILLACCMRYSNKIFSKMCILWKTGIKVIQLSNRQFCID